MKSTFRDRQWMHPGDVVLIRKGDTVITVNCDRCGNPFSQRGNDKHCLGCKSIIQYENRGDFVSGTTTGASNELIVCADLLRKGWSMYRSVSPNAAFDLVAAKPGKLIRIEVRSYIAKWEVEQEFKHPAYDIKAIVSGMEVAYYGELAGELK